MADYLKYTLLYEFTLGSTVWRYTANAEDVIDEDENVWEAAAISNDAINQSGEATSDMLSVTASAKIVPARLYMYSAATKVVELRILSAEFPDKVSTFGDEGVDASVDARVLPVVNKRVQFVGEIVQCGYPQPGQAVFSVETIGATMRREGLRLPWQRQCPYTIYDFNCKVAKGLHAVPVTITSVTGLTITVSGLGSPANGLYNAGLLEFNHPIKGVEALTIEAQTGGTMLMFGSVDGLYVGLAATAYRGCSNDPNSCKSFGNYPNYGGVPLLSGNSPFDGTNNPVF